MNECVSVYIVYSGIQQKGSKSRDVKLKGKSKWCKHKAARKLDQFNLTIDGKKSYRLATSFFLPPNKDINNKTKVVVIGENSDRKFMCNNRILLLYMLYLKLCMNVKEKVDQLKYLIRNKHMRVGM